MTTLAGRQGAWRHDAGAARTASRRGAWAQAAIVIVAFVLQVPLVLDPDLAWLLTVCEKMLAGGRLGTDIIELNPPLSVLMYMPAAYLGTVLPIPAHIFVIVMVLAAALLASRLTLAALRPLIADDAALGRARLVLLVVFTLVPGATFGQREHVAVLGLAPFVALAATLALRNTPPLRPSLKLLVGLSAGIAMCIKPHYALPAALPLVWAAARTRSLRPLFGLACWTAGATVVIYYAAAMIAYPYYFSIYPRWAAIAYLPLRMPPGYYVNAGALSSMGAIALMLHLSCGRDPTAWSRAAPWLMAALGGYLSYVIQGKDCSYMRLPIVTFGLLASLLNSALLDWSLPRWGGPKVVLLMLAPIAWLIPGANHSAAFEAMIRPIAPPHPRMLLVGSDGGVGEPLARKLDGEWASATMGQILAAGAAFRLEDGSVPRRDLPLAHQIVAMAHVRLREDLQKRRPDVVLVDSVRFGRAYNWEAWARQDRATAAELDRSYRLYGRKQGVAIWLRKDRAAR